MTLTSSVEPIRFISARSVLPAPCRLLSPAMYTSHVHAPLLLIGVSLLGRSSFRGRSRSAHSRRPAHLGQAVGERAVRGRAVAILVGQLRLAARLEDDGQIRSAVPQVAALTVVAPV